MSRVHDALRRAEQAGMPLLDSTVPATDTVQPPETPVLHPATARAPALRLNLAVTLLDQVALAPFRPAPESHLLDLNTSHETPAEEFRTLRTRLNHLQTL